MRQFSAAYQRLSAGRKTAFGRPKAASPGREKPADVSMAQALRMGPAGAGKPPAYFFIFIRPMKSRLPRGTPLVRRMS